jgi:hypothetical protein
MPQSEEVLLAAKRGNPMKRVSATVPPSAMLYFMGVTIASLERRSKKRECGEVLKC